MDSNATSRDCYSLKVDVDTHDGMRDGVPRLLDAFARHGVRATFFLSFGPDNAGKAIWNVFRPGFAKKMVRTGAPKLYGWRTILSGTLLPARPIATAFPEIVRRIEAEGHEVGVHAWDHRRWQDHLEEMDQDEIAGELSRACEAFARILGKRPRSTAAPAWLMTPKSLAVIDTLGLDYSSDLRGGRPGYPELDGYRSTTLQIPSTTPCLEELLAQGRTDHEGCADDIVSHPSPYEARVLPLHAEVEGGAFAPFLEMLLTRIEATGLPVRTLAEVARDHRARGKPAVLPCALQAIPGRSGRVFVPAATSGA